ncbi:MAG: hypothetical protein KatS3mg057_0613 [Herpetosiphonaceae bacterium]|nr:MAG: hypothetical protein KatS3mg057_0613 [Herpetosiphonaceae bacterium]
MPTQSRWYIRTALIWLVLAFIVGGAILISRAQQWGSIGGALQPVFYHLLMVGWTFQLICGVALWLFPVLGKERPRGDERLTWAAYVGLNLGLLLRALFEPLLLLMPGALASWAVVLAALLQAIAVWLFVVAIWPRVRGKRSALPQRRIS